MVDVGAHEEHAVQRVHQLADMLKRTVEIALDAPERLEWSPCEDSPIERERASLEGDWLEAHLLTWTYIAMTAQAATDHLSSIEAVLRGRTALGLMVMARTAGEAAGQGWWLAEGGVGHAERIRRAYALRARGLLENERLAKQFIEDASDRTRNHLIEQLDRVHDNRQRVLAQARDVLGLRVHRSGDNLEQLVVGPPSRTELFEAVLRDESIDLGGVVYGMWSGVAHSNPVTLLDYHDQVEIDEVSAGLNLRLLLSTVESTVYVAVSAHRAMMNRLFLISGWDADVWADWIDEQSRVMSAV